MPLANVTPAARHEVEWRLRGQRYEKRVVGGGYMRFDVTAKRFTAYASQKGYER